MLASLTIPLMILCAVVLWTAYASFNNTQHVQHQQHTLQRGRCCRGTVVGVQRPFLFDQCTRVYFEFLPEGSEQPLRCCHIERREATAMAIALPATGAQVQVNYLPEAPEKAVIATLLADVVKAAA